ncbi:cell division protein ZapE [Methylobrevis pamukkalensis]|uniref:AFG1-like ATPase n=1 Tax=Methylobrevis pamukkalensis TaxID=1439726 RepID=A0A1E3H7F5_9HYPH|nr:cell division protein ZapE [Methylobrevis pamukkalensis]ODN72269.1 AFG1-like ATPase [Methylobrevis pamukkalensis]
MTATPRSQSFGAAHATRGVTAAYEAQVASGQIAPDLAQKKVAARLDRLIDDLRESHLASKTSALGWLFGRKGAGSRPKVKGVYVWGSVGRGKTMLMDLFFETSTEPKKRRAHFLDFMADTHARIHAARQAGEKDPVMRVADALAAETRLLCFDEFSVTDITDAMILGRLFTALFERGVVVVATSNVDPDDLYKDGLNRGFFLGFVGLLKTEVDVMRLDSPTDYRLEKAAGEEIYITPLGPEAPRRIAATWERITAGAPAGPAFVTVMGRRVRVPLAAAGVARFEFADLCVAALGAQDYQAIARTYHTVLVENVPVMDRSKRNEAKRFITLIDTLYDTGTKLVCSAGAEPDGLYTDTGGTEGFEFARCASRLVEMRSEAYLAAPRRLG